ARRRAVRLRGGAALRTHLALRSALRGHGEPGLPRLSSLIRVAAPQSEFRQDPRALGPAVRDRGSGYDAATELWSRGPRSGALALQAVRPPVPAGVSRPPAQRKQ